MTKNQRLIQNSKPEDKGFSKEEIPEFKENLLKSEKHIRI